MKKFNVFHLLLLCACVSPNPETSQSLKENEEQYEQYLLEKKSQQNGVHSHSRIDCSGPELAKPGRAFKVGLYSCDEDKRTVVRLKVGCDLGQGMSLTSPLRHFRFLWQHGEHQGEGQSDFSGQVTIVLEGVDEVELSSLKLVLEGGHRGRVDPGTMIWTVPQKFCGT